MEFGGGILARRVGFRTGLKSSGITGPWVLLSLCLFRVALEVLIEIMKKDDKPLFKPLFGTMIIHNLLVRCSQGQTELTWKCT